MFGIGSRGGGGGGPAGGGCSTGGSGAGTLMTGCWFASGDFGLKGDGDRCSLSSLIIFISWWSASPCKMQHFNIKNK